MQINRLFEIVYLLLDKKTMTAQELADRFEVSKRTILRDIDILSAAKIPIYTIRGKGGGISIMDGHVINKAALSTDEQNQILFALKSLKATDENTNQVIDKLSTLFQKDDVDWIEVDFSRWGQGKRDNIRFNLLKTAILGKMTICFEYVSSYGEKTIREVCPLKLIFKSKSWYLQGFCKDKNDYRTFKLNRMLNVTKTNESFIDKNYLPQPMEASENQSNSLIEFEFAPCVAYRVYDEFDEGCIDVGDNGYLHVFARLPEDNWLYGFIMSFGKDITVLRPLHVRENILNMLN